MRFDEYAFSKEFEDFIRTFIQIEIGGWVKFLYDIKGRKMFVNWSKLVDEDSLEELDLVFSFRELDFSKIPPHELIIRKILQKHKEVEKGEIE